MWISDFLWWFKYGHKFWYNHWNFWIRENCYRVFKSVITKIRLDFYVFVEAVLPECDNSAKRNSLLHCSTIFELCNHAKYVLHFGGKMQYRFCMISELQFVHIQQCSKCINSKVHLLWIGLAIPKTDPGIPGFISNPNPGIWK